MQMINGNPMLQNMVNQNPMVREMLNNPQMMQSMMNPQMIQAALQMQQQMGQGGTGMGGMFDMMNMFQPQSQTQSTTQTNTSTQSNTGTSYGTGNTSTAPNPFMNMFGNFQQQPQQPQQSLEDKYKVQLQQLADMGFNNQEHNLKMLQQTSGSVNATVEIFFSTVYPYM